jgi:hypothetical protein
MHLIDFSYHSSGTGIFDFVGKLSWFSPDFFFFAGLIFSRFSLANFYYFFFKSKIKTKQALERRTRKERMIYYESY